MDAWAPRHRARLVVWLIAAAAGVGLAQTSPAQGASLEHVGTYTSPVFITSDPRDDERLFIVEKEGRIRLTVGGVTSTFLDQTAITSSTGEQGLLSMAFAPDFAETRRLYVFYTDVPDGSLRVDELLADGDVADPDSRRHVLAIPHPDRTNHNGGQLQFGPDGYLYVSTGDGGGPENRQNSQDTGSLLGKLLRIDPRMTASAPYSVPGDNPFVGVPGAREIWSYGLRNPWRFSFDRKTGALAIGDVGQSSREEVNFAPQSVGGGREDNFGWPCYEGSLTFQFDAECEGRAFTFPVLEHSHEAGNCAVIGGYVSRDPAVPELSGRYVYADLCVGEVRSAVLELPQVTDDRPEGLAVGQPRSFGEDACGRVYVASGSSGAVFRIVGDRPTDCAWSTPIDLSAAGEDALDPRLAANADGDAVFAWRRFDGERWRVQARTRPAGGTLGRTHYLSPAGRSASHPQVAVDTDGDAVFAWRRFDGESWWIQARARSADGTRSPIHNLSPRGQDAADPQVAVDADGDAVFAWRRFDGERWRVQTRARSADGTLSPTRYLSPSGQDAFEPQVAVDADGHAVFAWRRFDGERWRVQARARSADGTRSPTRYLSPAGRAATNPRVAVDADGDAVFAWRRFDGANWRIQARARAADGTLSAVRVLSGGGRDALDPQVSVTPDGDAVVAWRRMGASWWRIQARARAADGTLSAVQTLSDGGRDAVNPKVGIDGGGDAVVTWRRFDGSSLRIQASSRP